MVGRNPGELETHLQRPEWIDRVHRNVAPVRFIKRFQRIHARLLKLRPDQSLD